MGTEEEFDEEIAEDSDDLELDDDLEIDDDAIELDDDLELDDDDEEFEGDDDDDDGEEAVEDDDEAEEEPEEDEVLDDEDDETEESLEVLLGTDADEEAEVVGDPRGSLTKAANPIGEGEFTCRSCFLVKRRAQLADAKKLICLDCA